MDEPQDVLHALVRKAFNFTCCAVMAVAPFLPFQAAHANAAPPPAVIWLTFVVPSTHRVRLEGVQLVGCDAAVCVSPMLLQQSGDCDAEGCLSQSPALVDFGDTFACAGNRCRGTSYRYPNTPFRVIAQFSDRTRSSAVLGKLPQSPSERSAWRIVVTEDDLLLSPDPEFEPFFGRQGSFWGGFLLTQTVEILVASLLLWKVLKVGASVRSMSLNVFLINWITFPVVWISFPAWVSFQPAWERTLGTLIFVVAILYGALLFHIFGLKERRRRIRWIVGSLLALPLIVLVGLVVLFVTSYGDYRVPAVGLPYIAALIASEVFAVAGETLLLARSSGGALTWRAAWWMSLGMNAASYGAGLLVFGF